MLRTDANIHVWSTESRTKRMAPQKALAAETRCRPRSPRERRRERAGEVEPGDVEPHHDAGIAAGDPRPRAVVGGGGGVPGRERAGGVGERRLRREQRARVRVRAAAGRARGEGQEQEQEQREEAHWASLPLSGAAAVIRWEVEGRGEAVRRLTPPARRGECGRQRGVCFVWV